MGVLGLDVPILLLDDSQIESSVHVNGKSGFDLGNKTGLSYTVSLYLGMKIVLSIKSLDSIGLMTVIGDI
ncbi:protein of unknown function [Shewanella benthica]|uniref:Uncharacterized protein n=1 Tax=Shewanella benthica TaxID=43661 RepID=A0A330M4V6_9GAMM|nr:protein of unknown function [Shewanella benthica]